MPLNPYEDRKVSRWRPHGNGDLDIVRASLYSSEGKCNQALSDGCALKISTGVVCVPFDNPENIICTITSHTATGSCMRRSDTHTVPV